MTPEEVVIDKQVLNKELAKWRGLSLAEEPDYTGFYLFADTEGICHSANFTGSTDTCLKWLLPEARKRFSSLEIGLMLQDWAVELWDGADPALAFCLAIKKLIGEAGDKKDD